LNPSPTPVFSALASLQSSSNARRAVASRGTLASAAKFSKHARVVGPPGPPERAPWGLLVRMLNMGGMENAACFSYPPQRSEAQGSLRFGLRFGTDRVSLDSILEAASIERGPESTDWSYETDGSLVGNLRAAHVG
jgi:hypothetical protein